MSFTSLKSYTVNYRSDGSLASTKGTFVLRSLKIKKTGMNNGRFYQKKLRQFIEKRKEYDIHIVEWSIYLHKEKERINNLRNKLPRVINKNVGVNDFIFVKVIGAGASGDVIMGLKCDNDKFYAIKVISKELLLEKNLVDYAKNEKFVLDSVRCPFTIHMEYFFQTDANLYYVLPLVAGIDLFGFLNSMTKLPEKAARFYLAQILLSLEYLHFLNLVYRDLKPENITMDIDGYIKLIDFGYCKFINGRTYTVCGTPEYMAPELYNHTGYGNSVDWWAYGVLTYEMCAGYTPFHSDDISGTFTRIVSGIYKCPHYFSIELKDLLSHLIEQDTTKRYGNIKDGIASIKNHIWFNDINWKALIQKTVIAPYKPTLEKYERLAKYDLIEERPASIILEKHRHIFNSFNVFN